MSTHRRAWKQRAGVVVALVAGALLTVPATPALAAKITSSDGSVTIDAGRSSRISVQVNPDDGEKTANVSVTGLPQGVSCGGCGEVDFGLIPGPQRVTLTLSASDDAPAANGTRATVRVEGDGGSDSKPLSVTVNAKAAPPTTPPQNQTVKSISGKVTVAANGDAVPNAIVMLRDSQNHQYQTTSDGSGNYRFSGSSSQPISPGRIDLGATKDNVQATKTLNASAGQSLTGQRIALALKVEVSPSATPSATEEPLPTDEATEEAAEETEAAAPGQSQAASDDGGGFSSFMIILLGGLLVAAGVGTIVLLWMRRKNADEDDDAPVGAAAGAVPGARGAFRGADDQTRVVNRVGAAGPDPTMVGGTSLSDAPTMMHRPVVDDVPPDPYGAPPQPYGAAGAAAGGWAGSGYGDEPAQGGYGQQGGYGNAPSSGGGYGAAPASGGGYGGAPSADAGYGAAGAAAGAAAGGYGNAPASGGGYGSRDYSAPAGGPGYAGQDQGGGYGERYDEPTGRYTGESTGAYAPAADPYPTSTYQPDQGHGYGQPDPAPYGQGQEPAGGYGGGNGYGGPGGGYDAGGQQPGYDNGFGAAQGGYDQQGGGYGAGQGGYDQQGGYEQPAGGYGAGQGGYGQPGGYEQEPPQQRTGGYDDRGYDQQQGGGYYGDQAQSGRGRPDPAPQQDRGGRRLDWLDD
ncbi:carboxypeptidase-like regulatory domain-containing protein [Micromonospora purpureochromogenes]|uniref:carboxypeptidase-like regulatory domain-containing protein n=1 Tax=Micromonospora purpureochromogenes TaxID=47872 RepID=UPI0033CD2A5A